jgi:hypothetical protein
MGSSARLLTVLLAASVCSAAGPEVTSGPSLEVIGTSFRVNMLDGRILNSVDLIGAVLDAADETGRTITVRIDGVASDQAGGNGDVWLHRFSVQDDKTRAWRELCTAGPDGTVAGFPLSGRWAANGQHSQDASRFTITCTSGAAGKCVRFGYKPWSSVRGESLWDYHQACVRMVRADYGGDGTGNTRDGTMVDVFDRLGIQQSDPNPGLGGRPFEFEAAWGADGAICVRRTRIPEVLSVKELAVRYPHLRIGPDCSEAVDALIWNKS